MLTREQKVELLLTRASYHAYFLKMCRDQQEHKKYKEEDFHKSLHEFSDTIQAINTKLYTDPATDEFTSKLKKKVFNYQDIVKLADQNNIDSVFMDNESQVIETCNTLVSIINNKLSIDESIKYYLTAFLPEPFALSCGNGNKYYHEEDGEKYISIYYGYDSEREIILDERFDGDFDYTDVEELKNRIFDITYRLNKNSIEEFMKLSACIVAYITEDEFKPWYQEFISLTVELMKDASYKAAKKIIDEMDNKD